MSGRALSNNICMVKNTVVRSRVNITLKQDVEKILDELGLSISDAINIFLYQIKINNGLPFEMKIPNKETRKILKESAEGKNIKKFNSANELFADLNEGK